MYEVHGAVRESLAYPAFMSLPDTDRAGRAGHMLSGESGRLGGEEGCLAGCGGVAAEGGRAFPGMEGGEPESGEEGVRRELGGGGGCYVWRVLRAG